MNEPSESLRTMIVILYGNLKIRISGFNYVQCDRESKYTLEEINMFKLSQFLSFSPLATLSYHSSSHQVPHRSAIYSLRMQNSLQSSNSIVGSLGVEAGVKEQRVGASPPRILVANTPNSYSHTLRNVQASLSNLFYVSCHSWQSIDIGVNIQRRSLILQH
jgi:hypothetical protein